MSAEIAQLLEDRAQYQEQLDLVAGSLSDDPSNAELIALRDELQSALDIIDESVDALKAEAPQPSAEKEKPKEKEEHTYKVNESILARWVTGDKAFYAARIMSITGSASAPMYTVKFKSYDTIETLRAKDIKPVAAPPAPVPAPAPAPKRKAETIESPLEPKSAVSTPTPPAQHAQHAPPPPPSDLHAPPAPPAQPVTAPLHEAHPPPPPPPPQAQTQPHRPFGMRTIDRFSAGVVSSAAAQIYTPAQQSQQRSGFTKIGGPSSGSGSSANANAKPPVLGEEPPVKKFKKIKATKQLEAGKSKWQEFSTKGKATKGVKKDSMFRTPDGVQGRVGFIGSGQAMRKDVTRSRHIYQTNEDVD